MVGEILTPVIWKVAPSLLLAATKHGIKKLFEASPVSRGIQSTVQAFPQFENLSRALTNWSTSEKFLNLLESLKSGERNLTDEIIVASFVESGGFYAGDRTKAAAAEILNTFLEKIEEEIYGSSAGLFAHAEREEILHEQTRTEVRDLGRTFTAQMRRLESLVQRATPDDTVSKSQIQEQVLHAKVDEARDLLEEGKATAARSILERLRRDPSAQSFSEELQFRIATNLGACAQRLGDQKTAKDEFRAALRYQAENPKAMANAAAAELIDGNFEEALRLSGKARQLKERDSHATSIYLQGLYGAGRKKEIEPILREEAWIHDDAVCTLTLGSLRYKDEQYDEAEKWLRISLEKGPEDPQPYSLLSQTIFIPLQAFLREDPPLPWQLPEPLAARAREAEALLTRAIDILERQENRSRLRTELVNRAAIRLMLGMFPEVLNDCDRVLAEDATDNEALRNKGVALLQLDRAIEAAACLELITNQEEDSTTILMLAAAYQQGQAYEKVVTTLAPMCSQGPHFRQYIDMADMLANAYMKLGKPKEAAEVVRQLAERWPGNPDALATAARQRRREGKLEEAGALLREAISYARDHQRQQIALQLADLHYEQEKYSEAAALYAPLVETGADNQILQRYLIALFNAGSYREALTLAQSLRGDRPALPIVTEIEALILEHIGDLEAARSLRAKLSEVEPKKVSHRVDIALLDIRRGERERAKTTLSEIRFEDIKYDAKALMQVAQARAVLGMGDVLPLAYRARRLAFSDPDVHLAYLGLFFRREDIDRSLLEPGKVGVDCTVHLRRNGESRRFTILDGDDVDRDRDELTTTDSLALKLIGKHKGDEVVLKDNPLERLAYEVAEVQSKYVFAFQETIAGFTTWFPDHPALHRVEFEEGDFSKIKTLLDARQKRILEAKRLYRAHNLNLGAFARVIGSRPSEVWAGMISRPDGIVIASSGVAEDLHKERVLLASAQEVVADLIGLLTFEYLGLLDRLAVGFRRVIVPQAVLDEINETLSSRFVGPKPSMTIWKEGDQYFRQETPAKVLEEGQEFLRRIRSFIESNTEIAPVPAILDFEKIKFEEVRDTLGRDAIAAVLVARERKLLLFSDDFGLRSLAHNDWQVEGVWSQTILVSFCDRGFIKVEEYREAIRRLALGNYYFLSINAEDLMWVLSQSDMKPTYEVFRMLSLLEGPNCSEDSAIRIIADLVRKVWLEPTILYDQKLWVLDLALGVLTKGRMMRGVVERLKAALGVRFRLMPLALPVIFRSIDLWGQQRIIEGSMIE